MKLTVTNTGRHPTEVAGRVFPARATVTVDVDESRADEVRSHGRLVVLAADDGLDERTVDELRDLAKARDLPVSGTKAELAARIRLASTDGEADEVSTDTDEAGGGSS